MFGRTKKEIVIYPKYQKDIWTVEIDRGQIAQVLLNLYVNAWQAMREGGNLYIQTKNITLDENYVKPYKLRPGRYVTISVTDTGVGMDETTQEMIFDPFFTTKEMGRGVGLGLASVYGIIKSHDGIINVNSKEGEGTTFNIFLPATDEKIIHEDPLPEDLLKGSETLLIVDDEDMIINICKRLLQEIGHKVLIAKSGKEALEIYEKNKDEIAMVILDMIMPDMGGGETYDKLKEIDPQVKVLLASGYSINGKASEILARGCNGFIQKPFTMENLSHKINEILDKT
jgi:CheY-like chemotaxis protein